MIEYLNLLIVPVIWILFGIQRRLTRVETKIEMLCNLGVGCEKEKE